ncbi:biosynthetic arginine decarboxylase [Sulfidibacter corallicola]|uniref:Biosynthetic arginine decarboxylase n=1 Tax=Sulfidibacter corallicola TaxID=2818388 RepID=A0A8A4TDS0_SULCO|nr:biosynthetic arginine decarboxylase [Sulfidibacter corallicola]QTD48076.1 biosynthetic arginine decarboxylase [Sulfidibacter corallicola]
MTNWSLKKANEVYKVNQWGLGYFAINESGNVCVRPSADSEHKVDLKKLVDELRQRKINVPVLIRFMDILRDRIAQISTAFKNAIVENEYQGQYYPLFPIKVNQERDVVSSMLEYGKEFGLGLEAGSKAELLIVLALTLDPDTPIVCNGYKDREFVQLVGMAHKMGKKIFPVIENYDELETFIAHYKETGIMPRLGMRIKLSTKGVGKWAKTGGDASKFGLRIPEVLKAVERLREENLLDSLNLLHFHIGSQITKIKVVKQAIVETLRVFAEIVRLGAKLEYLDIGGGLGVDYDGSSQETYSTINYTLQEYASDIVYRIQQICQEKQIAVPNIFSESGRFLAAHYSMLITNVPTVSSIGPCGLEFPHPDKGYGPVKEMYDLLEGLTPANSQESFHDAVQYRSEALSLFNLGYLTLPERAYMEELYWRIMRKVYEQAQIQGLLSPEMEDLEQELSDTYFANFSLFQSLPDSWAIDQIFPIIPIHRLNEEPDRIATVVDLTCDSDGVIDDYIGEDGPRHCVPLHSVHNGNNYYIGIFMIGAYQETLGELHNLFGDTHAVQIRIQGENQYKIESLIKGDTIHQVLTYVSFNRKELLHKMREQIEQAVDERKLKLDESAQMMDLYEEGLYGYTYFEE